MSTAFPFYWMVLLHCIRVKFHFLLKQLKSFDWVSVCCTCKKYRKFEKPINVHHSIKLIQGNMCEFPRVSSFNSFCCIFCKNRFIPEQFQRQGVEKFITIFLLILCNFFRSLLINFLRFLFENFSTFRFGDPSSLYLYPLFYCKFA